MQANEKLIVDILKDGHCFGQDRMMTPETLIVRCKERGLENVRDFEVALVNLIDSDVVEYEIDDATLKTTELWLIEE